MKINIKMMILLLPFLVTPLWGAEVGTSFLQIRKSSGVVYYEELAAPFSKVLYVEDGRLKQGFNASMLKLSNVTGQKPPVQTDASEALKIGGHLLQTLIERRKAANGENVAAPLELLYRPLAMRGDISYDSGASELKYKENPSSYLALVYLELALIHHKNGDLEKSSGLLIQASESLHLEDLKFPNDAKLRATLPIEINFGRPESAILYLRAQIALRNSQPKEASRIAEILISNNPTDPYAWQALLEFGHLGTSEAKLLGRILESYPTVLGCSHLELTSVSKEQFSELLPSWIERARKEIVEKADAPGKKGADK